MSASATFTTADLTFVVVLVVLLTAALLMTYAVWRE